jgi:hypothetical protein
MSLLATDIDVSDKMIRTSMDSKGMYISKVAMYNTIKKSWEQSQEIYRIQDVYLRHVRAVIGGTYHNNRSSFGRQFDSSDLSSSVKLPDLEIPSSDQLSVQPSIIPYYVDPIQTIGLNESDLKVLSYLLSYSSVGKRCVTLDYDISRTFSSESIELSSGRIPYLKEWVGIFHGTYEQFSNLLKLGVFIGSLQMCKAILVFDTKTQNMISSDIDKLGLTDLLVSVVAPPSNLNKFLETLHQEFENIV